jgi:hypothetical protein
MILKMIYNTRAENGQTNLSTKNPHLSQKNNKNLMKTNLKETISLLTKPSG